MTRNLLKTIRLGISCLLVPRQKSCIDFEKNIFQLHKTKLNLSFLILNFHEMTLIYLSIIKPVDLAALVSHRSPVQAGVQRHVASLFLLR